MIFRFDVLFFALARFYLFHDASHLIHIGRNGIKIILLLLRVGFGILMYLFFSHIVHTAHYSDGFSVFVADGFAEIAEVPVIAVLFQHTVCEVETGACGWVGYLVGKGIEYFFPFFWMYPVAPTAENIRKVIIA